MDRNTLIHLILTLNRNGGEGEIPVTVRNLCDRGILNVRISLD